MGLAIPPLERRSLLENLLGCSFGKAGRPAVLGLSVSLCANGRNDVFFDVAVSVDFEQRTEAASKLRSGRKGAYQHV